MTSSLRFTVPIPAVGKARPRVVGQGGKVHAFTPEKTRTFERVVALHARVAVARVPGWPKDANYHLAIKVFADSVDVEVIPLPRIKRASRFDLDNVAKAIADALNKVAYDDDRQVTEILITDEGKD